MQKRYRGVLRLLLVWVLLAGCGAPMAEAVLETAEPVVVASAEVPVNLTPAQISELREDGAITVIDVRELWEYDEGHIPGATLIPLGELPNRLDEVPTEGEVVFVCRSGNRSGQALRIWQREGHTNGHNMVGGMLAWQNAGYAMEK